MTRLPSRSPRTWASARIYGWTLGGKDNYEIDRRFALAHLPAFPEIVDIARENRRFLYRAVRYLAQEVGIRQFIDMGCGLPTENNVHQVARRFAATRGSSTSTSTRSCWRTGGRCWPATAPPR